MLCLRCDRACIGTKYTYSKMYTELVDCLHKDSDAVKLKRNHKCFNQCLMQMGVARAKIAYVVVWTTHRMVKDNSTFDKGP